jgi:aromatic ring-opening dioxygenase catalytic subunit (LigB family)
VPFIVAFWDTDIPIIQISLKKWLDPKSHIDLWKSLSKLREEWVLILWSGMNYHNMRWFFNWSWYGDSIIFNKNLEKIISKETDDRNNDLINWKTIEKAFSCHPREEHLLPLMVISWAWWEDRWVVDFRWEILWVEIISVKF